MQSPSTRTGRSPDAPIRWGILGAARILRRLVPAIRETGGEIVVIGASRMGRAQAAAAEWHIPKAVEGYAPVVASRDVDAIYLPLANHLHFEWLLATADAGKHCLCEKPLVLTADHAREARERFARAGRVLMEGFMWRHHAQAAWLAGRFMDDDLGRARRIHATFSFPLDRPNDYRWSAAAGGGALADVGCYGLNAARYFFGGEPIAASFRGVSPGGADTADVTAAGWLDFDDGRLATISCSIRSAFAQSLEVVGAHGRARLDRPWLSVDVPASVVVVRAGEESVHDFPAENAYVAMASHFAEVVAGGSGALAPAEDGLPQAVALEGMRASARAGGALQRIGR